MRGEGKRVKRGYINWGRTKGLLFQQSRFPPLGGDRREGGEGSHGRSHVCTVHSKPKP